MNEDIIVSKINSPVGDLLSGVNDRGVWFLEFCGGCSVSVEEEEIRKKEKKIKKNCVFGRHRYTELLELSLKKYFTGKLKSFGIPLNFIGTEFQKKVWNELLKIPYGQTISYQEQARRMGNIKAVRAVANANGANKIVILIPCHRVIGKSGSLTGFGGGLSTKKYLLDLEKLNTY